LKRNLKGSDVIEGLVMVSKVSVLRDEVEREVMEEEV